MIPGYIWQVCEVFHGWPSEYLRTRTLGNLALDMEFVKAHIKSIQPTQAIGKEYGT